LIYYSPCAHYRLVASIDLSDIRWGTSVIPRFAGTFDGNEMTISHLTINGAGYLGLFGRLESGAQVKDIGVLDVNISSSDFYVGALAGSNGGNVTSCYSTGAVMGYRAVVGLLGYNGGAVSHCYSSADVGRTEPSRIVDSRLGHGGLVGCNIGDVTHSFSTGSVIGASTVGGLAGSNDGSIIMSYSTGMVRGESSIGGLVGNNSQLVQGCYSTGAVNGESGVGGLVGSNISSYIFREGMGKGIVTQSFWDIDISGQTTSAGGAGKTTDEMQTASTFLDAGWDFVDETANGTEDIWWIDEGQDYPHLCWEEIEQ